MAEEEHEVAIQPQRGAPAERAGLRFCPHAPLGLRVAAKKFLLNNFWVAAYLRLPRDRKIYRKSVTISIAK